MTRTEFMQELKRLLSDIPEEEKREAIEFYDNYFEEAGKDEEENVIKELGSPAEIAESIKKSLEYGSKDTGYFAEDGYHEGYKEKANLPSFERRFTEDRNRENSSNETFRENRFPKEEKKQKKGPANILLVIILVLFALPVGLPIVITLVSLLAAAVVTVAAIWIAFVAVSVSLLIVGVVIAIVGVLNLSVTPAVGLSLAGGGLIVLGVGILFTIATVWIAGKALPAVIGWVKQIFGRIFRRRRAYA
ncbi:DUF1700 domain-containing protein [Anaerocolumna xylanovorans]|uniref:Uncharacterized membrane protein n=1 Tax=Anaerocolumna xylanovorans DSM 12503 TaxID=1121345 RepID=A0A1M7Y0B9_9FIRM|nr:DUF1700 domain-containing protein [Anaerocolumna xylanovorans]SHO44968.1 Uncharacterized membrane protein [Anaerocolumna xylanovorans DSM 12503]